jgi:hypothetical protein
MKKQDTEMEIKTAAKKKVLLLGIDGPETTVEAVMRWID